MASTLPTPTLDQVQQKMAGLAVPFEANQGQFAPEVAFAARTFAGTLFVTRDGKIVHALAGKPKRKTEAKRNNELSLDDEARQNNAVIAADYTPDDLTSRRSTPRGPGWALVESLQGAGELAPMGSQPSAINVSRFLSVPTPNQTSNIATFDRIRLGEAWPGVAVELAARGSNVEKLFTVAPGANPKAIRMGVAGAKRLRLSNDGRLIATTGNGDIAFTPPIAFQHNHQRRQDVPVRYVLLAGNSYRFEIGPYERNLPLVIDPLLQSTYLGTSDGGFELATALALDAAGNVLVTGNTESTNFPGTVGGAQSANGGGMQDVFVARLSSDLATLMQATYIGGNGTDSANAIALDASGNVLVAGSTVSTNFPGTSGGAQPVNGGGIDAFVARLSSNLTMLVQSTYLGGSMNESAAALSRDTSGNVLIAGFTGSTNFPGTFGGAQSINGGGSDAFVARLSGSLTTLAQATYLGGSGSGGGGVDQATAIALDAAGTVLVAGFTTSTDFPGTAGGAQATFGGDRDAFVARLSNDLHMRLQTTYLGGSNDEVPSALVIDSGGSVLVAGTTNSTNFPGTSGGVQPAYGGGFRDTFIARLSNSLTTLIQATYLGGSASDNSGPLALDANGNVFVAGSTTSTDFPGTTGGVQSAKDSDDDCYVARLSGSLATLGQATYLGGNHLDRCSAMALDSSGNLLLGGYTASTILPGTAGGAQPAYAGGFYDAFVTKLSRDLQGNRIFLNGFE